MNTWVLQVSTKSGKSAEVTVLSEAASVTEFLSVLHDAGFACVQKLDDRILDGQGLTVKVTQVVKKSHEQTA